MLLVGSYFFYGWWSWKCLLLLIFSTFFTFILAKQIQKSLSEKEKQVKLNVGLLFLIGLLVYFKYTNFFIGSFISLFHKLGIHVDSLTLNIILPLGISFYTFRLLSYLSDVKNGKFKATDDWVAFFTYVAYFPSLVSGPIDRPKTLLPQLEIARSFNYEQAVDGLRQILWGLFKKVVVADNCGVLANYAFDNHGLHGFVLLQGAFFYTIQIYADFSGYSDMALGISKLLGFNITINFRYPYFSQNISEFWRKWHISLTSWLTEYVFTPFSIRLRDLGVWGNIIAILITFLVSGLWHGANWTFVAWGFLHGCYFIPLILKGKMNKRKEMPADKMIPSFREAANIVVTFSMVMFAMILFRSDNLHNAFHYYANLLHVFPLSFIPKIKIPLFYTVLMLSIEWKQRDKEFGLELSSIRSSLIRWSIYLIAFFVVFYFMFSADHQSTGFMYVKF